MALAAVLALCGLLALAAWGVFPRPPAPGWQEFTASLGARNAVAAVVLGSRLLDTLLEVLVFATAMVGVRIGLRPFARAARPPAIPESHLLLRAADVLMGPIVVFSLYLAASGHLGPGGGFPAGAVLGTGLLLFVLAKGAGRLAHELHEPGLERLEYGAVALLVAAGGGLALAGRHGAGLLVVMNLLIGLEVAIGAWVVLHYFAVHRGEV
ncbi:MAG: MnhB domain-containing protein [Candidatus Bipolaricaulaceae bacterium]